MTFQRFNAMANPQRGVIAAINSRYKNRISRHRLRRGCHSVTPGGKTICCFQQPIQQHRDQEFALEPSSGASIRSLRQLTQTQNRFHPLEREFDLPPQAVQFQKASGGQGLGRKVRPKEDITGQKAGDPRDGPLLLGSLVSLALTSQSSGNPSQFDGDQPTIQGFLGALDPRKPLADLPDPQAPQTLTHCQPTTTLVLQRQAIQVDSDNDMALAFEHRRDARRGTVAPIAEKHITRSNGNAAKRFAPVNVGQLEMIALEA